MKFNPQLKQGLEYYEKKRSVEIRPDVAGAGEDSQKSRHEAIRPARSEKVAGGIIIWKPIDRAAALLLAKAPWWAHPPPPPPLIISPPIQKPELKKQNRMSQSPKNSPDALPHHMSSDSTIIEKKGQEQLNCEIASHFVKQTDKALDKTRELLDQALDARAAMDVMCDSWKTGWLDFCDTCDARLKEMRMTRMAMDSEMRQLLAGLREVRAFFLDKDYNTEIARLKDFVETCERLQKLKESGFLDTVAETMLRLAVNETGT